MRSVCEYLDARRLLTTEVIVREPRYHHVAVSGRIVAAGDADLAEVKTAVDAALRAYFHPLHGGETGDGWPFGGDIYYSRVYQRAFVRGVDRIDELIISVDGKAREPCANVPIEAGALVYSTGHAAIRVDYDEGAMP